MNVFYQDKFCTAFQFNVNNKQCKLCQTGDLTKPKNPNKKNKDTISGLCPKVKKDLQLQIEQDIQAEIIGDTKWCATNGTLCNFPFKFSGKNYYKPITRDNLKKCITDDNTFQSLDMKTLKEYTESQLVPCSPCPDYVARHSESYLGFPLVSEAKTDEKQQSPKSDYAFVTLAECQYLCYITKLCLYFSWDDNYPPKGTGVCDLKYGMGKRVQKTVIFGHKNDPGLCLLFPLKT